MPNCSLDNIRLINTYHEAYMVNLDGTMGDLILSGPPKKPYPAKFLEYYCAAHDCSFKQWKGVLGHLGNHPRKEEIGHPMWVGS